MGRATRPAGTELERVSISAGQVLTDRVSTPAGRMITSVVARWPRVHPSHLTLVGLVVGVSSAVATATAFSSGVLVVQVLAVVGWQVAYAFDCADGQLARLTGRSSQAGGELDVFVDVAVQSSLVIAVGVVAIDHGGVQPALALAFAVTWGVGMVATLLARLRSDAWTTDSLRASSRVVWLSRQVRDYALAVLVVSAAAAFSPSRVLPWVLGWFTLVNGAALLAYVATRSLRTLRG